MLDNPLTEAEFEQLDDFLMNDEAPSDTMDMSMLDGYLAAVAPDKPVRWEMTSP